MLLRSARRRHLVRPGFTLMEMMVVVAIIVALAGIGIVFLLPQAEEGNKAKAKSDIKNLTSAVQMYHLQHNGNWPDSLQTLTIKDEFGGPYVETEEHLLDPWRNVYNYDPSGTNNQGRKPDIWCVAPGIGIICNWTNQIVR